MGTTKTWATLEGVMLGAACAVHDGADLISRSFPGTCDYWGVHGAARDWLVSAGLSAADADPCSASKTAEAIFYHARRAELIRPLMVKA